MRSVSWCLPVRVLLLATSAVVSGCLGSQPAAATTSASALPSYVPTATVKDLHAVAHRICLPTPCGRRSRPVQSLDGTVEIAPDTDEKWTKVRHGAIALAEAANLLQLPGRQVARPGEKSETPGVELEPLEMEALITKDPATWNAGRRTFTRRAWRRCGRSTPRTRRSCSTWVSRSSEPAKTAMRTTGIRTRRFQRFPERLERKAVERVNEAPGV